MYPSTYVTMWRCIYTALDYPYPPAEYPLQEPIFVTSKKDGERNMALRLHLSCDCSLVPASCPRVPIFVAIFEDQPMVSTRKNQPQNGLLKPLNQGRGRSNTMIFDVTLPDHERKHTR